MWEEAFEPRGETLLLYTPFRFLYAKYIEIVVRKSGMPLHKR